MDSWRESVLAGREAVVYCVRGGSVSRSVAEALEASGVAVRFLEGGLEAWKNSGHVVGEATPDRVNSADVELLRAHGLSEGDVAHSIQVADIALKLAVELPAAMREALDMDLVVRGALLHDLGKGRDGSLKHGEAGYRLALELGLSPALAGIMDKHVLGGLTAEEAEAMGLPMRYRTLSRLEEKLVVYADKLADILEETDLAEDLAEARAKHEAILMADLGMSKNSELARDRYIQAGKDVERAIRS